MEMRCVHCGESIDESMEYDQSKNKKGQIIYMCEECLDYSGKTILYYENKNKK